MRFKTGCMWSYFRILYIKRAVQFCMRCSCETQTSGIPTCSELQYYMRDVMNACAIVASASADRYGFKYLIFRKCMNADLHHVVYAVSC